MDHWQIEDMAAEGGFDFAGSIGDPSGFYFPLASELGILKVNKQMRWDALPVAYRRTIFHTDEVDDLVRLPVAVGATGRDNILSVDLRWASSGDSELERSKAANNELLPT